MLYVSRLELALKGKTAIAISLLYCCSDDLQAEALLHDIQDCEHAHNIRLDSVRSQEEQDLQPVAQVSFPSSAEP